MVCPSQVPCLSVGGCKKSSINPWLSGRLFVKLLSTRPAKRWAPRFSLQHGIAAQRVLPFPTDKRTSGGDLQSSRSAPQAKPLQLLGCKVPTSSAGRWVHEAGHPLCQTLPCVTKLAAQLRKAMLAASAGGLHRLRASPTTLHSCAACAPFSNGQAHKQGGDLQSRRAAPQAKLQCKVRDAAKGAHRQANQAPTQVLLTTTGQTRGSQGHNAAGLRAARTRPHCGSGRFFPPQCEKCQVLARCFCESIFADAATTPWLSHNWLTRTCAQLPAPGKSWCCRNSRTNCAKASSEAMQLCRSLELGWRNQASNVLASKVMRNHKMFSGANKLSGGSHQPPIPATPWSAKASAAACLVGESTLRKGIGAWVDTALWNKRASLDSTVSTVTQSRRTLR